MMRSRFDIHNLLAKTNRSVMRTVYSRRLPQILSRRDFCLKPILDSKIRNLPTTYRLLSTESSFKGIGDGDNGDNSIATKWIAHFNATVAAHAETSIWTFLALRVGTWYTLAYIYTYVPDIGPELAIGYLVCKFTGKLRQPANLGLAALISYQFPILSTIKASALIGLVKNSTANQLNKPTVVVKIEKFLDWMTGPIDKYGFSYFIASKVNMGVLLLGASFAVKTGLDIPAALTYMGISEGIQNGAGSMGAATLTNVLLTPFHLVALTYLVPLVVNRVQPLSAQFEKKLKDLEAEIKEQKEEDKRKNLK